MKKAYALLLLVALMFSNIMMVHATGVATLGSVDSVSAGQTVEIILSVSDCPDVSSVSVDVSYGDNYELVSGTWLITGAIVHYDTEKNKGAVAGMNSLDINGELFQLVLKAKAATEDGSDVSITLAAKNGSEDVIKTTASKRITVSCPGHTYDGYAAIDENNHQSECSVCGDPGEVAPHQVGPEATETTAQVCTLCGYELQPALGKPLIAAQGQPETVTEPVPEGENTAQTGEEPKQTEDATATIPDTIGVLPDAAEKESFPWWIFIPISTAVILAVALILIKKKK